METSIFGHSIKNSQIWSHQKAFLFKTLIVQRVSTENIIYCIFCHCLVTKSCSIHCDLLDCNPPDSSDNEILQARILEWVAMPLSRGSSQPQDWTCLSYVSCIERYVPYHWHHLGSSIYCIEACIFLLSLWKYFAII